MAVPEARLPITICWYSSAMAAAALGKVVFRMRRVTVQLAVDKTQHLPFVLLQKAVVVIFRMTLEEDEAELVGADHHVYARVFTFYQNGETGRLQLGPGNGIVAGVGGVEARVDIAQATDDGTA